jgi:predicted N-acyltransferase
LESRQLLRRVGCQFHWTNRGYSDFGDFLGALSSGKRKNIRKERRKVADAGITFRLLSGHTAADKDWATFHRFYENTFDRRGGIPTLSRRFFERIAHEMPDQVLLVMCDDGGDPVASAFCLVGDDTLYGRHWGCEGHVDSLHFEACYYQGIEFCIRKGLKRFEPGAQGEHKIPRGFLPTETLSAHWISDPRFQEAIAKHLDYERDGMGDYIEEMNSRSPYRHAQDIS